MTPTPTVRGPLSRRIAARRDPNATVEPAPALRGPSEPTVDARPAWLRRRDAGLLPAKVLA